MLYNLFFLSFITSILILSESATEHDNVYLLLKLCFLGIGCCVCGITADVGVCTFVRFVLSYYYFFVHNKLTASRSFYFVRDTDIIFLLVKEKNITRRSWAYDIMVI